MAASDLLSLESGSEEDSVPDLSGDAKKSALKEQFAAMKAGDWDKAAEAAQRVYDACAMGGMGDLDDGDEY